MSSERYYIHGDFRDDGKIYCRRCDSFESTSHLDPGGPHDNEHGRRGPTDFERASRALKDISQREVRDRFKRPKNARNYVL